MSNNLDPKILAKLNKETAFIQSQQRGTRQIKLVKGQTIVVRFLPAKMGPSGIWYARVANHWLDRRPITCPRLTDEDWGGNTDADCPVCTLAEQFNDDRDEAASNWGWQLKANPQYMTYCVLLEQNGRQMGMEEIMVPYAFLLNKSVFEELHAFYVAGGRKAKDSVLDYHKGNDFSVMRTQTRTRLDKLDSLPIFDEDANFDGHIKKLEALLKEPRIKLPTDEEMEAFLMKAEAASRKIGAGDEVRPRRRAASEDDEAPRSRRAPAEDDEAPRSSRRAPAEEEAPRSRRAPAEDEAPRSRRSADPEEDYGEGTRSRRAPAEDDEAPRSSRRAPAEEEAPRSRRAPAEEEAPRSRRSADPEDDEAPRTRKPSREENDDDGDLGPQRKKTPAAEEDADPETPEESGEKDPEATDEAKAEADPEDDPRPAGRKLTSPPNRARAEGGKAQNTEDDDENLPEEERDPAPPAKEPISSKGEAGEPPPVSRAGKTAEAVRSRLSNLGKEGKK